MGEATTAQSRRRAAGETLRGRRAALGGALGGAAVGALLAACSGGAGGQPAGDVDGGPASKAPVTLAVTAGGWVAETDKALHRQVWDAFAKARPHVTLDINEIAFTTDKLLTAVAAGEPPDAAYIHPNDLPAVAGPGAYQNLDEFVKRDKSVDLKGIFPKVLEFFKFKDVLYQLPYHSGPSMIYYNKSLFQRLGVKTPEEYDRAGQWQWRTGWMEAVRLLSQERDGPPVLRLRRADGDSLHQRPHLGQRWGDLQQGGDREPAAPAPAPPGIQGYADMWSKLGAVPDPANWQFFTRGDVAMVFGFRGMGPLFRTITDFEVGMWHNPSGPAGAVTRSGPSGYGVVSGAKHAAEAWEFCKNYVGPAAQGILFSGGFNVPMTSRKEDADAFRKDLVPWEKEEVYMEAQDRRLRPMAPLPLKWREINVSWNREWALIRDGQKTAQQSMTELRPELDALLK